MLKAIRMEVEAGRGMPLVLLPDQKDAARDGIKGKSGGLFVVFQGWHGSCRIANGEIVPVILL